jgi:2'-5' RNA ligase
MPQDTVKAACEAASGLQACSSRFSVHLNRVVSFGRHAEKRPLVLRDSGEANLMLKAFRINLWDALAAKEVPGGPRSSFTPHVTLLYDAQMVSEHAVNAVSWEAHEFVLLHSAMQETRYEVLGRWPLLGQPS